MSRSLSLDVLDNLKIASPCTMTWEELDSIGDETDRVRHCSRCALKVFNVANLTRDETLDLVSSHVATGKRLCAALYRRPDGTLLTRDCPVGLEAIRRRVATAYARSAAAVLLGASMALTVAARVPGTRASTIAEYEPFASSRLWLQMTANQLLGRTVAPATPRAVRTMGSVGHPPPPFPRIGLNGAAVPATGLPRDPDGSVNLLSGTTGRAAR